MLRTEHIRTPIADYVLVDKGNSEIRALMTRMYDCPNEITRQTIEYVSRQRPQLYIPASNTGRGDQFGDGLLVELAKDAVVDAYVERRISDIERIERQFISRFLPPDANAQFPPPEARWYDEMRADYRRLLLEATLATLGSCSLPLPTLGQRCDLEDGRLNITCSTVAGPLTIARYNIVERHPVEEHPFLAEILTLEQI